MLTIHKHSYDGNVYHVRIMVPVNSVGMYIDLYFTTGTEKVEDVNLTGTLLQGESWGIEKECLHHELYGEIDLYPDIVSGTDWVFVPVHDDRWPESGSVNYYGYYQFCSFKNGCPFHYEYRSSYGYFYEIKGRLKVTVNTVTFPRVYYNVKGSYSVRQYDFSHVFMSEKSIDVDYNSSYKYSGVSPIRFGKTYPVLDVKEMLIEAFKQIDYDYDEAGNSILDNLFWECYTKIAEEIRVSNCNLLAYGKDMAHSTELLEPYIDLFKKGINAKTVASCFLGWFYGTRLTTLDSKELFESSSSISLSVQKDQPSHDAYQTAVLRGYKGSYDEYVEEFNTLGEFYSEGNFTSGFEFLASALLSSVTRHATRTLVSKHARSKIATKKLNDELTQETQCFIKLYCSPYSSQIADKAILNSLQAFDLQLSLENIVDFIPLSFVVNWFLTTGDSLENLETYDFLQTLPVAKSVNTSKIVLHCSTEFGVVEYQLYNRKLRDSVPSPPIGISFKGDLSFLSHWQEATALIITLK